MYELLLSPGTKKELVNSYQEELNICETKNCGIKVCELDVENCGIKNCKWANFYYIYLFN